MREMNLDRLRTLVTIADLGSFAEAARSLHLAPPTISMHIADLEQHIGAALLSRQRGQIKPTSIGESLIARARRLLADAEQALHEVQRQVQGLAGRVTKNAWPAFVWWSEGERRFQVPRSCHSVKKKRVRGN